MGAPEVKYRDAEAAIVASRILTRSEERKAFLSDREGYLAKTSLPADAKQALLAVPDAELNQDVSGFADGGPDETEGSGLQSCLGDFFFC